MSSVTSFPVRVPLAIRHRPGRKSVVTPLTDGVAAVTTLADQVKCGATHLQGVQTVPIHGAIPTSIPAG